MAKAADPARLHIIPIVLPRHRLADIDRTVRREALSTIYDALGPKTFRQRLVVTRKIIFEISRYHFEKSRLFEQLPKEREDWFNAIANHADALADLITAHPHEFGFTFVEGTDQSEQVENAVNMLYGWADLGRHCGAKRGPHKPGPRRDWEMILLIERLRHIYKAATGKDPARTTNTATGKPTGPFVRMMRGVCNLGGIAKSDESIATSIRHWQAWVKSSPNFGN